MVVCVTGRIGLVRVSADLEDIERQRATLDPMCHRVFDETASRKRLVTSRPELLAALNCLGPGDRLMVYQVEHLGHTVAEALMVLSDLFDRGVVVHACKGIAPGAHINRTWAVDVGRDLRAVRRDRASRAILAGLREARNRGVVGGRPHVVDAEMWAQVLSRRARQDSIRSIAQALGVSVGTVHNTLSRRSSVQQDATSP